MNHAVRTVEMTLRKLLGLDDCEEAGILPMLVSTTKALLEKFLSA